MKIEIIVLKSLLTTPNNILPLHLKQSLPPIIWIFTEGKVMESNPGYLPKSFLFQTYKHIKNMNAP